MKPTDKAIFGMVSESPGRNASEPSGGLDKIMIPEAEPCASRIANSLAESRVGAMLRGTRYLTYAVSRMKDLLLALLHLAVCMANSKFPGVSRISPAC
jgi:hypothetical protein